MKAIGLLGGTFDPVHNAHLAIASQALAQFSLDKVIFIPTGTPVRKLTSTVASAEDRLAMLKLACANYPNFEISTIEIERSGITYSIDTLEYYANLYSKDDKLYFITGKDTTADLPTWKNAERIAKLVTVLSANRPSSQKNIDASSNSSSSNSRKSSSDTTTFSGSNNDLSDFDVIDFEIPELDISSSEIRNRIKLGLLVEDLIPTAVLGYIRKHSLYD